jgi:hypothetical protein
VNNQRKLLILIISVEVQVEYRLMMSTYESFVESEVVIFIITGIEKSKCF